MNKIITAILSVIAIILFVGIIRGPKDSIATTRINEIQNITGEGQIRASEEVTDLYAVRPDASVLTWRGGKANGTTHFGRVTGLTGFFNIDTETKNLTQGGLVVNLGNITAEDVEGDARTGLLEHLLSKDFFQTDLYPDATFAITKTEGNLNDKAIVVYGDLTIKDETHPIVTTMEVNIFGGQVASPEYFLSGTMALDRTKWGITFGSTKLGTLADKAIKDTFEIDANIVLSPFTGL